MAQLKTEKNTEINRLISENDSLRSALYAAQAENDRLTVGITDNARDLGTTNNAPSLEAAQLELKLANKLLECQWGGEKVVKMDEEMNHLYRLKGRLNEEHALLEHLNNIATR